MKWFFEAFVELLVRLFQPRRPQTEVGSHPYMGDECRTVDGEACTVYNLDRIPRS